MQFRVGPYRYRVQVKEDLRDDAGMELLGLCDTIHRVIYLAASLPPRRRLGVLLHELKHAWQEAFGTAHDAESQANQAATFTEDVLEQLENQGGVWALLRLGENGVVDHSAAAGDSPADPRGAQCPVCAGLLSLPIRQSKPEYEPRFARLAATREADCDFCGHAVRWVEAVTSAGVPSGKVLSGPEIPGRQTAPSE